MVAAKIGDKVCNKRTSVESEIVLIDDDKVGLSTLIPESGEVITKTVTHGTFERWYRVVDATEEDTRPKTEYITVPQGQVGDGVACRDRFIQMCKELGNQEMEIISDPDKKTDIVRYNGRNVFECSFTRKHFNVMCHQASLTPENYRRAHKIYPKEWGWALRAKFIFTNVCQWPLMKSIITDGLFYRQKNVEA